MRTAPAARQPRSAFQEHDIYVRDLARRVASLAHIAPARIPGRRIPAMAEPVGSEFFEER